MKTKINKSLQATAMYYLNWRIIYFFMISIRKYLLFVFLPLLFACSKEEDSPGPAVDIKSFDFASTKWGVFARDTGTGEYKEVFKQDEYIHYHFIDSLHGLYKHQYDSRSSGSSEFVYYHFGDTLHIVYGAFSYTYKIEKLTTKEMLLNNYSKFRYSTGVFYKTPVNRIRLRKLE